MYNIDTHVKNLQTTAFYFHFKKKPTQRINKYETNKVFE